MGFHVAGPHRCIGFLEDGILSTFREYGRNWHKKLRGWTVNLHILQEPDRFRFKKVEINGKIYDIERLLECPLVPRKESGGYELNVLFLKTLIMFIVTETTSFRWSLRQKASEHVLRN